MRISVRYIYHAAIFIIGLFLCLTVIAESRASSGVVEAAGDVFQIVPPATAVGLAV